MPLLLRDSPRDAHPTLEHQPKTSAGSKFIPALLIFVSVVLSQAVSSAPNPCDAVDRGLTRERATQLSAIVTKHLTTPYPAVKSTAVFDPAEDWGFEVVGSLKLGPWQILAIDAKKAEPAFLFYKQDPMKRKFLYVSSGALAFDRDDPAAVAKEKQALVTQLRREMPKIPEALARCFAQDRVEGHSENAPQ